MARKRMRVSGTQMKEPADRLYMKKMQDGWQMDVETVKRRIETYLDEAAETGKYSVSGLCIALNIPRGLLGLWREGFACETDIGDSAVYPNEELSRCIEMALLHIQRYWEECDKPSTMNLKQLEATGALGENASVCASPPFDLGRLKKFAQ